MMTRADFIRQAAEARKTMQELARLFPGCFHADGRPIVASAHLPTLKEMQARHEPPNVEVTCPPRAGGNVR